MASMGDTATGDRRRRRVLFFPLPYQGHINPMFQLAGVLHSRGFAVTVFHTHFNAPDASRHPAYDFVPVPDGTPEGSPPQATVEHILDMNRACEEPFRERLAAVLERQRRAREHVACLVPDAHLLTMLDVARGLGVPTLVLRTGSAACFRCFLAYPMLHEKGYLPPRESNFFMPVKELPPLRVRDLFYINGRNHGAVRKLLARAVEAVKSSSGLVINTFDALETAELERIREELGIPMVLAPGPLHKHSSKSTGSSLLDQDNDCIKWLDKQSSRSVLYVSLGSLASMDSSEFLEVALGFGKQRSSFSMGRSTGIGRRFRW